MPPSLRMIRSPYARRRWQPSRGLLKLQPSYVRLQLLWLSCTSSCGKRLACRNEQPGQLR